MAQNSDIEKQRRRHLHGYKNFIDHFPRFPRVTDGWIEHPTQDSTSGYLRLSAKDEPVDAVVLLDICELDQLLPKYNQLLIYRIISRLYGSPDPMELLLDVEQKSSGPMSWSFTFSISKFLFAELRSHNHYQIALRFWRKSVIPIESTESLGPSAADFLMQLNDLIEKNLHLFDEKTDIKNKIRTGIQNIYLHKYQAANRLFEQAIQMDTTEATMNDIISTKGYLYFSSSMLFIVSFEALVNLMYDRLLKGEFRYNKLERYTTKADLDARLLTMHSFCEGFTHSVVNIEDDFWKKYQILRDFRNHFFHGNLSDEEKVYGFQEDSFLFFYHPAEDVRGASKNYEHKFPKTIAQIDRNFVASLKETVDMLRDRLLDAMSTEKKNDVQSWIESSTIFE